MPEVMMGEMPSLKLSGIGTMGPWDHGSDWQIRIFCMEGARTPECWKKWLVFNLHPHVIICKIMMNFHQHKHFEGFWANGSQNSQNSPQPTEKIPPHLPTKLLHQSPSIWSQDHSHPIKRIGTLTSFDPKLAALCQDTFFGGTTHESEFLNLCFKTSKKSTRKKKSYPKKANIVAL